MLDIKKLVNSCKKYVEIEDIVILAEDIKKIAAVIEKSNSVNSFFIIVPRKYLTNVCNCNLPGVDLTYTIRGVFDMGRLYGMDKGDFTLVHVFCKTNKKEKIGSFKIGIFQYPVYQTKNIKIGEITCLTPEDEYCEALDKYLRSVEDWVNKNVRPKDSRKYHYEFNPINIKNFDSVRCYPRYYSQKAFKTRQFLATAKTVLLSEVAEILLTKELRISDKTVKRVMTGNLAYPLDVTKLPTGKPTTVKLQKGDIVFPRIGNDKKPLLIDVDLQEDIYAGPFTQVIRCHNMQPEYLYLYITSEVAVDVFESITVSELTGHVLVSDLIRLPIVKPVKDAVTYRHAFENLVLDEERRYTLEETKGGVSDLDSVVSIEDLLNLELASKIKVHNEMQLRKFLTDDLKELKVCYEGKAYKATLILAGSILEAVLIDWLSEIDGKNYFEVEYPVSGKYQAQLIDYIDAIKMIKAPAWMEEARKAHMIREKRNLVHAKLCLKKSMAINDKTCWQVLQYLTEVLKTRGIEQGIEL